MTSGVMLVLKSVVLATWTFISTVLVVVQNIARILIIVWVKDNADILSMKSSFVKGKYIGDGISTKVPSMNSQSNRSSTMAGFTYAGISPHTVDVN